mgnify:CR=1 FL=1
MANGTAAKKLNADTRYNGPGVCMHPEAAAET